MAFARVPSGKINYYIDGKFFENSEHKRDGLEKAQKYCLDNMLDINNIIRFDSRTETKRYMYLLEQEKQGLISKLTHHFTFKIRDEESNAGGEIYPVKTYESDFTYLINETNERVIEDVKGTEFFITPEFIDTKRDFDMTYKEQGLYIRVMLLKGDNWIQWKIGDKKTSSGKMIKKQREEIKQLRAEKHEAQIKENKDNREKARLFELRNKEKLNSTERKRLAELENKFKI